MAEIIEMLYLPNTRYQVFLRTETSARLDKAFGISYLERFYEQISSNDMAAANQTIDAYFDPKKCFKLDGMTGMRSFKELRTSVELHPGRPESKRILSMFSGLAARMGHFSALPYNQIPDGEISDEDLEIAYMEGYISTFPYNVGSKKISFVELTERYHPNDRMSFEDSMAWINISSALEG